MKRHRHVLFLCLSAAVWTSSLLLFSGCATDGGDGREEEPREYEYVMPSELRIRRMAVPTPTPAPPPVVEEGEGAAEMEAEDEGRKKRSWLGRLFSRGDSEEEDEGEEAERRGEDGIREDEADAAEEDEGRGEEEEINNRYTLKEGDTVYISLSGSGGLSEQVETVIDERGNVKLRYIGAVRAAGRTPTELEREIEAEYTDRQKIYKEVVVRVVVPNTFYFIGGEVRQPGRFPLMGRVTLSQAIVTAGNFTEWANPKRIVLVRDNERTELNFREITENPDRDVELQPGDVITVDRSTF